MELANNKKYMTKTLADALENLEKIKREKEIEITLSGDHDDYSSNE